MFNVMAHTAEIDKQRYPRLAEYVQETGLSQSQLLRGFGEIYDLAMETQWNQHDDYGESSLDGYTIRIDSLKGASTFIPSIAVIIDEFYGGIRLMRRGFCPYGGLGGYDVPQLADTLAEVKEQVDYEMETFFSSGKTFTSAKAEKKYRDELEGEAIDEIAHGIRDDGYGVSPALVNRYLMSVGPGDPDYKSIVDLIPQKDKRTGFDLALEAALFFSSKARVTMHDPFGKGSLYPQTEVW